MTFDGFALAMAVLVLLTMAGLVWHLGSDDIEF